MQPSPCSQGLAALVSTLAAQPSLSEGLAKPSPFSYSLAAFPLSPSSGGMLRKRNLAIYFCMPLWKPSSIYSSLGLTPD